jgi:signal transduction histidine kinase
VIELDRRRRARAASAAVARERRRLARELHDGLAQELAYLRTQSRRITGAETLVEAADRALEETRAAISGLVRSCDEPLERSVEAAAVSVGERHGVDVVCDLSGGVEADDATREALLRVLREAIANASRHGGARSVRVELRHGPALSVMDDGRGFAPSVAFRPDALGIASMRERVEALGGTFSLSSLPQAGTRVEVALG